MRSSTTPAGSLEQGFEEALSLRCDQALTREIRTGYDNKMLSTTNIHSKRVIPVMRVRSARRGSFSERESWT
jgi:hypothetical protein